MRGPISIGEPPQASGLPRTWKPICPAGEHYLKVLERRNGSDYDDDDGDEGTCDALGWTPLHEAAASNAPDQVAQLLQAGANARCLTREYESALDAARQVKSASCVALLLAALSPEERLLDAAKCGDVPQLQAAFAAGASVEAANAALRFQHHHHERSTVLHWASAEGSSEGHVRCIAALLSQGADVNACDRRLWTPLLAAVTNHQPRAVAALLAAKANPLLRDCSHRTSLDHASGPGGCRECAELITDAIAEQAAAGPSHSQEVALDALVPPAIASGATRRTTRPASSALRMARRALLLVLTALTPARSDSGSGSHGPVCPDTRSCPAENVTVLKIVGGTPDAAFGNLFYSTVSNGLIYAQRRGYAGVWVSFEPSVVNMTMGDQWAAQGPLWERFFRPFCPNMTAWVQACRASVRVLVKRRNFWYPFVQQRAEWAIRQWYNHGSDAQRECNRNHSCRRFNATLFSQWRRDGATSVAHAHQLNDDMEAAVQAAVRAINPARRTPVLALHLRGSDKASARVWTQPEWFEPYIASFFSAFPDGQVIVATEYKPFADIAERGWRRRWGKQRLALLPSTTRVPGRDGNFRKAVQLDQVVVAREALMDIQVMARAADYFLHAASSIAEAVIYTNPRLHCRSTHLEYEHNVSSDAPWLEGVLRARQEAGYCLHVPSSVSG